MQMRSYGVARGLFSLLSALAWVMIVGGAFAAFAGFDYGAQMRSPNPLAMAITMGTPGVALFFFGFIMLATSQVGRASVDTAEYSQQMLQTARDHMDVSKQLLRQGEKLEAGYTALAAKVADAPSVSYTGHLTPTRADAPITVTGASIEADQTTKPLGYGDLPRLETDGIGTAPQTTKTTTPVTS
jgi:hypothetical protein